VATAINPQADLSVSGATVGLPRQEGSAMTATTDARPDVPLPAGAVADDDAWAFWDNECRFFRGADRVVLNGAAEVIAEVRTSGMQLPDGSIDNGEDEPRIDIHTYIGEGLTSAQSRELASILLEAAAEIDAWAEDFPI